MTPKEKGIWMMSIYNAQYEDYKVQAARDDLTEAQKDILRQKKEILVKVYPHIKVYIGYAETGIIPEIDLENIIIQHLEKLLSL